MSYICLKLKTRLHIGRILKPSMFYIISYIYTYICIINIDNFGLKKTFWLLAKGKKCQVVLGERVGQVEPQVIKKTFFI